MLRQTPLRDAVVNAPNYADIATDEDAVASEVHSRLTGAEGARLMQDMIDKARQEALPNASKLRLKCSKAMVSLTRHIVMK